jgi:phage tail-like protein
VPDAAAPRGPDPPEATPVLDWEIRRPIAPELPAVFQAELDATDGDAFLAAVLEGFDRSLAPVHVVLDELAAYVDPDLVPEDLLPWLLTWLGLPDDRSRPVDARRRLLRRAGALYPVAGTASGLADQLTEIVGWDVEIEENGATIVATRPDEPLPGDATLSLRVRFVAPEGVDPSDRVLLRRLTSVVQAVKPAHVPHTVEVVAVPTGSSGGTPSSDSTPS